MTVTTPPEEAPRRPLFVLERTTGWDGLRLRELWLQRELLFTFTKRNILVRYKQTVFGVGWAILQPLFLMVVFTLFFKRLGNASSNGLPYPIFSYGGLLPWTFFSVGLAQAAQSLVTNQNLLRKIYFPRLIIPVSTVLTSLVDFCIASVVLFAMMAYYTIDPFHVRLLAFLPFVALVFSAALGFGLWFAALNVKYRDVQYVIPFVVQGWLFATPAVYVAKTFGGTWGTVLGLNPMQSAVAGARWSLLGSAHPAPGTIAVSVAVTLVVLVSGVVAFRRFERQFADVV